MELENKFGKKNKHKKNTVMLQDYYKLDTEY